MQVSRIMNSGMVNPYKNYNKSTKVSSTIMQADKLEISENAFELYTEKQDIRLDKVQDIRSRIAAGSYMVNSTDIVDSMMKSIGVI